MRGGGGRGGAVRVGETAEQRKRAPHETADEIVSAASSAIRSGTRSSSDRHTNMRVALVVPTPFAARARSRASPRASRRPRAGAVFAASVEPSGSSSPAVSSRRAALVAAGVAAFALAPTPARAVAPPPTPDASNSAYIRGLLAKSEANRDVRAAEMANKNCLRQSAMGIGDCAGLPEDELKAAMEESARRLETRRARDEAEAAERAAQVEAYEAEQAATRAEPPADDPTP